MLFRNIIGQKEAISRLLHAVQQSQIAHAQLFAGAEGVGGLALAMAYARYIQCTNPTDTDACGVCPSCRKHTIMQHPDVHFVFPIVKSEKTKMTLCDDYLSRWREFVAQSHYFSLPQWLDAINAGNSQAMIYQEESSEIIRKLTYKNVESQYKILIVWLPERMNDVCANKLLKIIEEPYEKTLILMISESPQEVISTLLSRTQRLTLPPLTSEDIAQRLEQEYALAPDDARQVAHTADGNYVAALERIRINEDKQLFFDLYVRLMRSAYQRNIKDMKTWSEEAASLGRERQRNFLTYAQQLTRENYLYNLRQPELNHLTPEEEQFSGKFAPFINDRNIEPIIIDLEEAFRNIGRNANPRILFFDFSIKMIIHIKNR